MKRLIVICVMAFFSIGFLSIAEAEEYKRNDSMAYVMIQEFVDDLLKNPIGAKFAHTGHGIAYSECGYYIIYSYVDVGVVRTRFIGEVRQVSESNWTVVSLQLL